MAAISPHTSLAASSVPDPAPTGDHYTLEDLLTEISEDAAFCFANNTIVFPGPAHHCQRQSAMSAPTNNSIPNPGKQAPTRAAANSRAARRLITWTDEKNAHLIVALDHVCKEHGIKIPYDEVARLISPDTSGGAIEQHVTKLRNGRIRQGLPTHPPTKRSRKMINVAPAPVKAASQKGRARRSKRSHKPVFDNGIDPDAASDPDAEFGAPSGQRGKGAKGRNRAKQETLTPDSDEDEERDIATQSDEPRVKDEPRLTSGHSHGQQSYAGFHHGQETLAPSAMHAFGHHGDHQGYGQYAPHQLQQPHGVVDYCAGNSNVALPMMAESNVEYPNLGSSLGGSNFSMGNNFNHGASTDLIGWGAEPRTPTMPWEIEEPQSAASSLDSFIDYTGEPTIAIGLPNAPNNGYGLGSVPGEGTMLGNFEDHSGLNMDLDFSGGTYGGLW